MIQRPIRLAIPSKGKLQSSAYEFLAGCGMKISRLNPRQYEATISNLDGVTVIFQRPGDIVAGVRQGSLDFGITGLDMAHEKAFNEVGKKILILHEALGFGHCSLNLAVPDESPVQKMADCARWATRLAANGRVLRVATKFPRLTGAFLETHGVSPCKLIPVEGTLEIAPVLGYADLISDLVSTGITLRDNHLRPIADGRVLQSQACLIANRQRLQECPSALSIARKLLEYMEAHLRAADSYIITANVRGDSPEAIAERMFDKPHISGLQGPTISRVVATQNIPRDESWFAVNIVVNKVDLVTAIAELRQVGGSGVIVSPCIYIFEEEPARYKIMLQALAD